MSSVPSLREFIIERLTAAAEEIFGLVERTVVQYEEEIHRQRRLLDITRIPEIKLHRIDLPQQHACKEEEVLTDQQLCNQERSSSLGQEEPEPLYVKEEQEELCSSQQGEQLVLRQETDTFMEPTDEESEHSEPDPKSHQILSPNSLEADSPDQDGSKNVDSGSTRHAALDPKNRCHRDTSHSYNVDNSTMSESQGNTDTGKKSVNCDVCGKAFKNKFRMNRHYRTHTGERPYCCETCGKTFSQNSHLTGHMRSHLNKKLHFCKTCGKGLSRSSSLNLHMMTHTCEKPYLCQTCGKGFKYISTLKGHTAIHKGEKPHICNTCGKRFIRLSELKSHMRTHTDERPYPCEICGKSFRHRDSFLYHMRSHTGEKPHTCNTCGDRFIRFTLLKRHMRIHTSTVAQ